jgi:bifunctional non-homologous end joining protein LigD
MCAVPLRRQIDRAPTPVVPGAKQAPFPGFITPCDPSLRDRAPDGLGWLHEIKIDGYRAQVHVHHGRITVYSRSGYNWTDHFHQIAHAVKALSAHDFIIDGEATVFGNTGLPDFQALRRELAKRHAGRLVYLAFDLLYLDGHDLRGAPLMERKRALQNLLANRPPKIVYVEHFETHDGEAVYRHACKLKLEGIVSKRRDSRYRSGRQETWLKLKCTKSDTFPIVAFVEKLGARPRKIDSLYVGRREGGRLIYAGKARSGYTEQVAREVRERLDPLIIRKSPLSVPVKKPKATWVRPLVQAEIEYGGITDDGLLREAVFKGLRDDLPLGEAAATTPRRGEPGKRRGGVPRENILQLLPDAVAPSKEKLAAYWRKVAKRALPYLARRPLKLVRHTRGTTFYHKGPLPSIADDVHQLRIEKREGGQGVRVWVDSLAGILGLVEMDVVEVHPWAATVDDIEEADTLVFDLDPGDGIAWDFVVETAFRMRELLEGEGLKPWPKLTGGKGLHLMAPLPQTLRHDAAHNYARRLAQQLARTDPDRYVTSASLARRPGRLFIDYLRNGRGTTAVGAYSPRVREGFPIAAPVMWKQVERGLAPNAFTLDHPFSSHRHPIRTVTK